MRDNFGVIPLSITVNVGRDHLIHRKRSPFPYEGKALTALKLERDCECQTRHFLTPASEAFLRSRRGEAHRRPAICGVGWVGGVYPSAPFKARTAAFDGQRAFTRAARSAGLNFAVILLSKAMDVGRDHLIHRRAVPLPLEGKDNARSNLGRDFPCWERLSKCRAPLLPIAYCLLPLPSHPNTN